MLVISVFQNQLQIISELIIIASKITLTHDHPNILFHNFIYFLININTILDLFQCFLELQIDLQPMLNIGQILMQKQPCCKVISHFPIILGLIQPYHHFLVLIFITMFNIFFHDTKQLLWQIGCSFTKFRWYNAQFYIPTDIPASILLHCFIFECIFQNEYLIFPHFQYLSSILQMRTSIYYLIIHFHQLPHKHFFRPFIQPVKTECEINARRNNILLYLI